MVISNFYFKKQPFKYRIHILSLTHTPVFYFVINFILTKFNILLFVVETEWQELAHQRKNVDSIMWIILSTDL